MIDTDNLEEPPSPDDALIERVAETMQPLAGLVAWVMVIFVFYNAVDLPEGPREIAMVYDVVCIAGFGGVWWMLRRRTVPPARLHLVTGSLALLLLGNILSVELMLAEPFYTFYVGIVILGVAITMTDRRSALLTLGLIWAAAVVVLWFSCGDDLRTFSRHVAVLVAATAVAAAVFVSRTAKDRSLAEARIRDWQQRRQLKVALRDAESARASLDTQVEARTAALRSTNRSLTQEVEERKRAEGEARTLLDQLQHAQRMESIGQLAGGVAHDFNNLLAVILGNLEIALEDGDGVANREMIEDARRAAERGVDMTRQLLAFSRKQVIQRQVFDVASRLEGTSSMLRRLLGEAVTLDLTALGAETWIDADPAQIDQVLMNLLVNARDAMPDGGTIRVRADQVDRGVATMVRIRVSDDGVGMDDDARKRVFEPFFTTKPVGRGTGLGLSTAYGICEQHGGVIEVSSNVGEGSVFDVYLPTGDPSLVSATRLKADPVMSGTETVLLVEDDPAIRRMGERLLRRFGYEVLVAESGRAALSIYEREAGAIDLLWTDIQMPGMNGIELAEQLCRKNPELTVLYVSGYTGDYLRSQGLDVGEGVNLVYKPFRALELARLIRKLLDAPESSARSA